MKIDIETYKGQLIQYDDSSDKFICKMVIEDNYQEKKSLKLTEVRNAIDQFIKQNADFKPFKFISDEWSGISVLEIVAIRKDGKLVDSKNNQWGIDNVICGKQYSSDKTERSFEYDPEVVEEYNLEKAKFAELERGHKNRVKQIKSKLKFLDPTFLDKYRL